MTQTRKTLVDPSHAATPDFAVSGHLCGAYAVMSNHYHLVVHMSTATSNAWSAEEVARRWVALYPTGNVKTDQLKIDAIFANEILSCQLLREERALLAAVNYVDLNQIRANMAPGLNRSKHTSVVKHHREVLRHFRGKARAWTKQLGRFKPALEQAIEARKNVDGSFLRITKGRRAC